MVNYDDTRALLRRRLTLPLLALILVLLFLIHLSSIRLGYSHSSYSITSPLRDPSLQPIVSLASSSARLDSWELMVTLRSLILQSIQPKQIRLYLPIQEQALFVARQNDVNDLLGTLIREHTPLIQLMFVIDIGPASKYIYAVQDLLAKGQNNQALVIVDDDHSYSPDLLYTLLYHSSDPSYSNGSVGLRGWRVRHDLQWGVPNGEYGEHVVEGYLLKSPYRVGVLTANDGYLIYPSFFATPQTPRAEIKGLLDADTLASTKAHLVDDIWMAGQLCALSVPRFVVPLLSLTNGIKVPSIDVTRHHTLETHILSEGTTREQANTQTLRNFASSWSKEALFYPLRSARERSQRLGKPVDWQPPERLGQVQEARAHLNKLLHHAKIRLLYGQ